MKKIIIPLLLLSTSLLAVTIKTSYRVTNTALTVTNLASLANSTSQSTGIWASGYVDNVTNMDLDEQVYVQVKTGTTGVNSTGAYAVYAYGCIGGTTTCTDGISGIEGTATLTNPTNLTKLASCNAVANATVYTCGPFSIANAFGGSVPSRWGVVVQNLSGAAFAATNNAVTYDSVQGTSQ